MRVLGIDPGSRTTGWGVVERVARKNTLVASGVIRTNPDHEMPARLHIIHAGLLAVIAQFLPDVVAMEEIFAHRSSTSALVLGQARGVALLAAHTLPVATYNNQTVKKNVTGSGKADKDQVARVVGLMLAKTGAVPADESDALAIALTHLAHSNALGVMTIPKAPRQRRMSSRDQWTAIAAAAQARR